MQYHDAGAASSVWAASKNSKQLVHVVDVTGSRTPEGVAFRELTGARTFLAVPLLKEGELLGALAIYRTEVRSFTDKQIALVQNFAAQAVIAIENARLLNELRESLQQQTATADVLKVISRSTFDLQTVLNTLTELAARVCVADKGTIFQRDGEVYRLAANYGFSPEAEQYAAEHPVEPNRGSVTGRVALEGRAIHVPDVLADPEYGATARGYQRVFGYRTALGVPLLREGTTIGLFVLTRDEANPFTDKQIELVTTFADQAVIAIEDTRLFDEVQARTGEVQELLEYQTAISDVLNVISRSPNKLQPVLDTLVQTAARLCEADFSVFFRLHEGKCHIGASNAEDDFIKFARENPFVPTLSSCSGRALLERRTVHVVDASTDPEYAMPGYQLIANNRTMLGVPLLREGVAIGAITLWKTRVEPFTEKQIDLITTFADQALIAIENTRLFEAERERTRELMEALEQQTATSKVLDVISRSAFDLQAVFETVAENSVRLCGADRAIIFRFDGELLRMAVAYNTPPEFKKFIQQNPIRLGRHSSSARAASERRTIHIPDVWADPEYTYGAKDAEAIHTVLSVPILKGDNLLGVLTIYHLEGIRPFTDKQIALVETFADQAAIAIDNVRLLDELRQRTADLTESLGQQTATSEVLQVISSSPGDLRPVFETMLANATRLCDAKFGTLNLYDGGAFRIVAVHNVPSAFAETRLHELIHPHPRGGHAELLKTKRVVHIEDIRARPAYLEGDSAVVAVSDLGGARTIVLVPMLKEDALVGTITIYRQEVRPFTDKQIELVENFAKQAVIAIENARLLNELRQRTDELGRSVEELRALGEVSQAVNSTLDLETVLSTIVAKAVQLSGTDAGAIYVFDDRQRKFHLRATYGMDQELINALSRQHIGLDERNVALVLARREPTQVANLQQEPFSDAINQITLRAGFRARLVAPLIRGEDVVGLLVVRRKTPGVFPPNTVDLIKTFAAQSAVAIENARLFHNVEASLQDLRTAQDRLIQTEKLASLGQLTAGIAHEIKNPLNFVNNFSAVSAELIDELRDTLAGAHLDDKRRTEINEIADMLQSNLDKVVQHGKRADSIVKNMLLHSRQGSGEHRPVEINALVDESLNLAYHGARAEKQGFNITLERSFDPAAGEVDLFPQEITRVLLNLISNGFYAATKRKAEVNGRDYEPTLAAATKNLGDCVEIRIRDNGTGIPPAVREKLFNPFFTTKPAGEGTGLGLSISHDIIVKQHGGSIEVETQPGSFTEFRIVLPRKGMSLIK